MILVLWSYIRVTCTVLSCMTRGIAGTSSMLQLFSEFTRDEAKCLQERGLDGWSNCNMATLESILCEEILHVDQVGQPIVNM